MKLKFRKKCRKSSEPAPPMNYNPFANYLLSRNSQPSLTKTILHRPIRSSVGASMRKSITAAVPCGVSSSPSTSSESSSGEDRSNSSSSSTVSYSSESSVSSSTSTSEPSFGRKRSRASLRSTPRGRIADSPPDSPQGPRKVTLIDKLIEDKQQRYIETFRIIDANNDGFISESELSLMWKRLGKKLKKGELRAMIEEADTNRDGVLDLQEFLAFFSKVEAARSSRRDPVQRAIGIRLAFEEAALCHDGLISAAELQVLMRKVRVGGKAKALDCAAMIRCVDSDGDGMITFSEFEKLMMSSVFAG